MTNDLTFSDYATRLRAFIRHTSSVVASDDPLSPIESEQQFNRLALDLFALQFEHVSPYRQFSLSQKIIPETVSLWTEIPAIPSVAFKELELTSLPMAERTTVFHSSGTTGQKPSLHFHSAESLAAYEASLLPWFQAHLLADKKELYASKQLKFIFLTPSPALAPHSSLVHMFEVLRQKFGSSNSLFTSQLDTTNAWELDLSKTLAALHQSISANQPVALLGTAFNFVHLVDHLANTQQRLQLIEGSRVLETGGYKGRSRSIPKSQLHALITSQLGVPASQIVCEYGMSELSSQAYDQVAGAAGFEISNLKSQIPSRAFHFPPWARVQIISPETGRAVNHGDTGLIRILDLANLRSVAAIQTEDLGIRRGGDGFELLGRAALSEPRGCSLMSVQNLR